MGLVRDQLLHVLLAGRERYHGASFEMDFVSIIGMYFFFFFFPPSSMVKKRLKTDDVM